MKGTFCMALMVLGSRIGRVRSASSKETVFVGPTQPQQQEQTTPPPSPTEINCDLLVVGAGVSGAFTAARYRQFNPHAKICIVEVNEVVGGRLQSLPLDGADYQAEFGGMRYFQGTHTLVPEVLSQLGLDTTNLPYVDPDGIAYIRGKRVQLSQLGKVISSIYNVKPSESGQSPDALYNATINEVLKLRNISLPNALSNDYLVNHTMFNVLRDANMSQEAISAYTDTAGYEWVLGSNAAIVAQEDLIIEGWGKMQTFVKTGFQSLVYSLMNRACVPLHVDDPKSERVSHTDCTTNTDIYMLSDVTEIKIDGKQVVATMTDVKPSPVGYPIVEPKDGGIVRTIRANRTVLTTNPLQLFSMASWPWAMKQLLFDVEQVETVKIFLQFEKPWWNNLLKQGRSVTTLPLRQVWAYAPGVLMIYGDSTNARFWKPYLVPHATSTPKWMPIDDLADLKQALYSQLAELFNISTTVISASDASVAFAYWERCTAFWRAGCNIEGNIARSIQPIPDVPLHLASDLWSAQQGWVEGALNRSEAVLQLMGIPSIEDQPFPPA